MSSVRLSATQMISPFGPWPHCAASRLWRQRDPRVTQALLAHHEITATVTSYGPFNLHEKMRLLLHRLMQGQDVALVSDNGTPVIYDPGSLLVAAAHQAGIPVKAIPGPSTLTTATAISGFSGDAIIFEGHLPTTGRRSRTISLPTPQRTQHPRLLCEAKDPRKAPESSGTDTPRQTGCHRHGSHNLQRNRFAGSAKCVARSDQTCGKGFSGDSRHRRKEDGTARTQCCAKKSYALLIFAASNTHAIGPFNAIL